MSLRNLFVNRISVRLLHAIAAAAVFALVFTLSNGSQCANCGAGKVAMTSAFAEDGGEAAPPAEEEQAAPEDQGEQEEEAPPPEEEAAPEEQAGDAEAAGEDAAAETPAEETPAVEEEPAPVEEVKPPPPYTHTVRQLIPEAYILPAGYLSLAYLNRQFDEDSIASQGGVDSQGFRADFGLSERVQIGLRLWQNNTNNGRAIFVPFWDNTLTADMWETDIKLFLSGTPRPDAGSIAADKLPSAFTIGVSHQDSTLSREQADDDLRMLTGYVCYSTYLSPQLSTNTYFSTGRFTGDLLSGTMNTLGVGIDYDLLDERDKLRLSLDGALDIYNFRQTSFSATRVSHVNVGLKYMVTPQIEFNLGYGIHTDSDSDLSSTEYQFGLAFMLDSKFKL